ncbi:hypothetical protein [Hyphobacterium marinum]|uniref:Sel1 repeat family protein n=1 Tax=Hyphobacterium marinum TaxID=3116574 RepID=A0ABU7LVG8_9PROT|nr:hypothetical protein [Hyphobacterium sp. Y6023]MEE2565558.1 hypothetical protein [Hyphobacterium sp. Y6023]
MPARSTALSLVMACLLAAGCASGDRDNRRGPGVRAGSPGEMLYAQGRRLADDGNWMDALRAFQCAGQVGPGFEVAWHQAGVMAFNLATDPLVPAEQHADYAAEGFEALEMAARTGWGASQAELAIRHHSAGNTADAAYWAAVYRANAREDVIGLSRLPEATFQDIRARADYPAALERAADFFPRSLPRGEPGPDCTDLMRPVRERRELDLGLQPSVGTSRPRGDN